MKERWLWALEKQNLVLSPSETIPLGDQWDEWMASVMAYPFRAPVLGRSAEGQHDESRNPVIGHVVEWKVLSREEAVSRGVDTRGGTALYCRVEPAKGYEERCNAVAYVSPGFQLNFSDETGRKWPMVVNHVAEVSVPFQQLTQPDQRSLLGVQLSRASQNGVFIMVDERIEEVVDEVSAVADEAAAEAADAVAEADGLVDTVGALMARIDELQAQLAELQGERVEEPGAGPEEVQLSRAVRAHVAKEVLLKQKVDDILRTRNWHGSREDLVNLCRNSGNLVALQKSLEPKTNPAPRTGAQKARGHQGVNLQAEGLGDAAKRLQAREGIAFSEALKRAKAQRGGN